MHDRELILRVLKEQYEDCYSNLECQLRQLHIMTNFGSDEHCSICNRIIPIDEMCYVATCADYILCVRCRTLISELHNVIEEVELKKSMSHALKSCIDEVIRKMRRNG